MNEFYNAPHYPSKLSYFLLIKRGIVNLIEVLIRCLRFHSPIAKGTPVWHKTKTSIIKIIFYQSRIKKFKLRWMSNKRIFEICSTTFFFLVGYLKIILLKDYWLV